MTTRVRLALTTGHIQRFVCMRLLIRNAIDFC